MGYRQIKIVALIILMIYGSSNVRGAVTYIYFEQFEFTESIEDQGWAIGYSGDGDMVVETSASAAKSGNRGLHMKSVPNGVVEIVLDLNLPYHFSLHIGYQIFNVQNSAEIRILIAGDQGSIQLDYGPTVSGWEIDGNIYNIATPFSVGEWADMTRDVEDDIAEAISANDSPFTTFTPQTLVNFIIFQDGDGTETREIYFDDLIIFADSEYLFINPIISGITETVTETIANTDTLTLTETSPSSDLEGFAFLGWLLFIVIGILYYNKVYRKNNAHNENYDARINNTPPICTNCGAFKSPNTIFCGDCGKRH